MTIIIVKGDERVSILDSKFYSLAEAKAKFSRVIEEAKNKDIIVTKNGIPAAVVVEYEKYLSMMKFLEEILDVYLLDIGNVSEYLEMKEKLFKYKKEKQEV